MSAADHAILAPSSMNIVRYCPGALQLSRFYPEDDDKQAAREGTASHWAGQEMLLGRQVDIGQVAPNNVTLDIDMIEGAEMYVDAVGPAPGHVEERVDCSTVHPFCWGTPDFWRYDQVTRTLYVADYKYGHRYVDVFENWQLITYAAGIIATQHPDCANVVFTIVQPRNFHRDGPVRTWRIPAFDMRGYMTTLRAATRAAVNEDGTFNPNAVCRVNPGCRDCTGRRACPTLQTACMADLDYAGAPVPFDLPPAAVGAELRMIQIAIAQLQARESGLEEQGMAAIMAGQTVPWFRLARPEGRERWIKPIGEVVALGDMLGVDLRKRQDAITPTQARKAGLSADLVAGYAARSTGEPKLVADDGTQARRAFGT